MRVRLITVLVLLPAILLFLETPVAQTAGPPEVEWERTFGGSGGDEGYAVRQTSDGGYILVGETRSFGTLLGEADVWLIKTDSQGNQQWARTFGGPGFDDGRAVQQVMDGGYILVGVTQSFGAGGYDVWLIKTDSQGNQQWAKTFGGPDGEWGCSVQQIPGGGYALVWSSIYNRRSAIWLVATDAQGNQLWAKTFGEGGATPDYGRCLQLTSDGGYIVLGTMGFNDFYLAKLKPGSPPPPATGTIRINATLDGRSWSGLLSYRISGPQSRDGTAVTETLRKMPTGTYTLTYQSGGPSGASLTSITPLPTQTLAAGGTITFTLNFVTPAPTTGSVQVNAALDGWPWEG
ncbi:MAG: hypothetical protein NUV94_08220, partial [Candidatus Acetothermia bacterium]|nr:hypothetical protein [Candidatus Acetothermia bacterium]